MICGLLGNGILFRICSGREVLLVSNQKIVLVSLGYALLLTIYFTTSTCNQHSLVDIAYTTVLIVIVNHFVLLVVQRTPTEVSSAMTIILARRVSQGWRS